MYAGLKSVIKRGQKVKGTVVLMQKNVLDVNAITGATKNTTNLVKTGFKAFTGVAGAIVDTAASSIGASVALRLISATAADGNNLFISHSKTT